LHRNAGDLREEPGRLVNLLGFDSGVKAVQILARGSAMTISSMAVLPARSPMPLIVHSTWRAPARMAASELATASPRSLWQWTREIARSMFLTLAKR
jgi:hypothetical protein